MTCTRVAGTVAVAALTLACAHAVPTHSAPAPQPVPVGTPRPFAALYRLDCCRQSSLLVTVRGDGERLSVVVAAGPAGTVVETWLDAGGAWLRDGAGRCARPLPPDMLPLGNGATLPLDPWLAASLLSGDVPAEAVASPRGEGWLELRRPDGVVSWHAAGGVVAGVEVADAAAAAPRLAVTMSDHHGRVPGRLRFATGREAGELRLVEWRSAAAPQPPAWMAGPPCLGTR